MAREYTEIVEMGNNPQLVRRECCHCERSVAISHKGLPLQTKCDHLNMILFTTLPCFLWSFIMISYSLF
jgi:hypothetical protein